ncbi:MAG: hypothetical protein NTW86_26330 [Candidatus Sumerlaeota bacterium]|nr:hypothetical protein [Candidatus Sumerlaeota bacterium]
MDRASAAPLSRRTTLLDAALLTALAFALFLPALARGQIPYFMDTLGQFYPLRFHAAQLLHSGQWPLWNRTMFCGVPLLANPQWGLLYPLNWPFLAWPGPFWFTASYPLHFAIGACGVYALVKSETRSRMGAWAGALVFLFSSMTLSRIAFGAHHLAIAWTPWVWLAIRAMGDPRRLYAATAGAAIGIALQLLSGAPQVALYALMSYAAMALFLGAPTSSSALNPIGLGSIADEDVGAPRNGASRRESGLMAGLHTLGLRLLGLAAATAIGAALAMPQLLPTSLFLRETARGGAGLPLDSVMQGTLTLHGMAHAFFGGAGWPEDAESTAYIGADGAALIVLAIFLRPRLAAPFALFLLGALLFCSRALAPFLYRFFPTYAGFHDPKRILTIAAVAASVLAGLGMAAALEFVVRPSGRTSSEPNDLRPEGRTPNLRRRLCAALAVCLAIGLSALTPWPMPQSAQLPPALGWITSFQIDVLMEILNLVFLALLLVIVSASPSGGSKANQVAAIVFLVILSLQLLLFSAARNDLRMAPAGRFFSAERAAALPREGRFFAFDPTGRYTYEYTALAERMLPNAASYYGMEDAQGYDAFQLKPYAEALAALNDGALQLYPSHFGLITRLDSPLLARWGIAWIAGPPDVAGALQSRIPAGAFPFDLESPVVLPGETWLRVKDAEPLVSVRTRALWDDPFSAEAMKAGRSILILDADQPIPDFPWPAATGQEEGKILKTDIAANRVWVEARIPDGGGFVLLRDAFASGWSATVDGQRAPLLRAEGLFRAVPAPGGRHVVEFRYSAPGLKPGLALAALGALAWIALFIPRLMQWRRHFACCALLSPSE